MPMPTFLSPQMVSPTLIGQAAGALTKEETSQADYPNYALSMRFMVEVDELPNGRATLGNWSSCKGLKVDFKVATVMQGGIYTSPKILPECIEYDKIVLERAMRLPDSQNVQAWLIRMKNQWIAPGQTYEPQTATIHLRNPVNPQFDIMVWELQDVYPVSWSGPDMSADRSAVATEKLTLQHGGFL
jgi:phage tail-like protein